MLICKCLLPSALFHSWTYSKQMTSPVWYSFCSPCVCVCVCACVCVCVYGNYPFHWKIIVRDQKCYVIENADKRAPQSSCFSPKIGLYELKTPWVLWLKSHLCLHTLQIILWPNIWAKKHFEHLSTICLCSQKVADCYCNWMSKFYSKLNWLVKSHFWLQCEFCSQIVISIFVHRFGSKCMS